MTKRYIILEGQSNATGFGTVGLGGAPPGLPEPLVTLYRRVNQFGPMHILDGSPVSLDTTTTAAPVTYWGVECQMGLDLLAAGEDVTVLKACANGTSVLEWQVNDAAEYFALMRTAIQGGRERSGAYSVHVVSIRGEFESADGDPTGANNWVTNYLGAGSIYEGITTLCGVAPRVHMCRVSSSYAVAVPASLAIVRAKQSEVAIMTGGYLLNADPLTTIDGIHYDPASINLLGSMLAKSVLQDIRNEPALFYGAAA